MPEFAAGVKVAIGSLDGGGDVRRTTREAAADAGDAAFLGRDKGRRIAAAALQRLRQGVFSATAVLPACASRDVGVFRATGKGRLYSYVIHHRPVPGFTPPYAIAVVELDEGPRMMTNITQCPQTPEALQLDMPVEVAFEQLDDQITLPLFRPAGR